MKSVRQLYMWRLPQIAPLTRAANQRHRPSTAIGQV